MNKLTKPIGATLCGVALMTAGNAQAAPSRITKSSFGRTADGQNVDLYTLTNRNGAQAKITNYGGIVVSLMVPDARGKMGDVVLGFDTLNEYIKSNPYFGALIGRFGNRIAKGRFVLNGKTYKLATNNGPNHLHGGKVGFDKKVWKALPVRRNNGVALELLLSSPNGEEGYPGNLNTRVLYTLTNRNELRIDYSAVCDQPTVINLTHHTYFNLKGAGSGDILGHRLMMNANRFTPTDATSIPTGELRSVAGTPFDFRRSTPIGARIGANDQQIKFGKGYDHNYVLNGRRGVLRLATRVDEPVSGRVLTVYTTEPGMQLYTGNFLDGVRGKGGKKYNFRNAFCLEAQNFPDAPNKPNFPSSVLRPGQFYRQTTIYRFSTR